MSSSGEITLGGSEDSELKLQKPEERTESQSSICKGHTLTSRRFWVEVLRRKQELIVETSEARKAKSIIVIGLEGGNTSLDHGDLGVCVIGGKRVVDW
jgi:hypothetical protein